MDWHDRDLNYRRGRSGRPLMRLKAYLKEHGTHICWLCGTPIDLRLHWREPMSWSLDHATPLSIAPHLALELSNAREAHRRCNSARGNRPADTVRKPKGSRSW